MVKQRRSHQLTRQGANALSAVCLSAFLVFGNAVSVFGNDSAASRAKSRRTSPNAAAAPKGKEASTERGSDAASSEPASATSTPVVQPRKSVFRKVGEPFVVSTAAEPQSTPPAQTPAQRDATRPPGTEQQQTAPPTTRPNPQDPRTPPGTQQPAPQNPPGLQTPPVTAQPPATQSPTTGPTPTTTPQDTQSGTPT